MLLFLFNNNYSRGDEKINLSRLTIFAIYFITFTQVKVLCFEAKLTISEVFYTSDMTRFLNFESNRMYTLSQKSIYF